MDTCAYDKAVSRARKIENFLKHVRPGNQDTKAIVAHALAVTSLNSVIEHLEHIRREQGNRNAPDA